ncbi:MAG: hypothetical protein AAF548_04900 [Actinomycetota bacterium]
MNDEPLLIDCSVHGRGRSSAIVCVHHVDPSSPARGWVEDVSDPGDRQAWCATCEELFIAEGGMTDTFVSANAFKVVCDNCYDELRARHELAP